MASRLVVHSVQPDAEAHAEVAGRLRSGGIDIVEEQPHMLLVDGTRETVGRALGDARGWSITDLSIVPPPETRKRVLKPPS